MSEEFEKFIKPIVDASYLGTLAALSLAVLQVSEKRHPSSPKTRLLMGAMMFLLSAFFIFFYGIYPTRKNSGAAKL